MKNCKTNLIFMEKVDVKRLKLMMKFDNCIIISKVIYQIKR